MDSQSEKLLIGSTPPSDTQEYLSDMEDEQVGITPSSFDPDPLSIDGQERIEE